MPNTNFKEGLFIEIFQTPDEPMVPFHEREVLVGLQIPLTIGYESIENPAKTPFFLKASSEEDSFRVRTKDFLEALRKHTQSNVIYSFDGHTEGRYYSYFSRRYSKLIEPKEPETKKEGTFIQGEGFPTC